MKHREQGAIDEFNRIDMKRLERMKDRLNEITNAEIEFEIKLGIPSNEIIHVKQKHNCTLVVMGAQGKG